MAKKMAGTKFMIFSLVAPSIFNPRPMIKRLPTQVISAMTGSLRMGERAWASRVMAP